MSASESCCVSVSGQLLRACCTSGTKAAWDNGSYRLLVRQHTAQTRSCLHTQSLGVSLAECNRVFHQFGNCLRQLLLGKVKRK